MRGSRLPGCARERKSRVWAENSHSFRVPMRGWTIIRFSSWILRGRGSMVLARRLRARLLGCVALCMVVSAYAENIAAQSQPPRSPDSHQVATNAKLAERRDVALF